MRLGYLGDTAIVIRGAGTGLTYLFGPRGRSLLVDGRDLAALLATGRFSRV